MPSPYPRKQFAQHWLQSDKALNEIVKAAALSPGDRILEIGPGTGILTRQLLSRAESVVAVEIDRNLSQKLAKKLGDIPNFLLLCADFLDLNLESVLTQTPELFHHPNKVVANIPYNITGPILEKLLGTISHPPQISYQSVVLLIQKEVAERINAAPGSRTYGALSVRVQYVAECEYICTVPAKAFYPAPKVDSAVVRLSPRPLAFPADRPRWLETLVKVGFSSKRKMLRNNLKGLIDRDQLTQFLEQLNINPQVRAEDLSVSQWVALSNLLTLEPSVTP
ncbi:16S rRNA (adenine(1518)-N(6)/adenine(1519)-N(6))-dimethyltransferase RsmA [Laspinema olomoucense]|uniref:Ribosomal RNA small subunit methyltransferase A n=1 Tax=Laspinema olomoucense D3b TaxID=2953688 RepID=A0ABT2NFN8_9CYAN|nr:MULTISPECIES: 16S rRNA (adenine(1518)-N(6)/adenine(1519)-N(6))-dimethyltransferase RsmA [unclassified Laspinema]MCT7971798.1 16S rRNA (adenine(1518)-N(6)/adenine(1519)-N(6))-dimethyltransferase RsmA [Laspinema sp. D3d]MCT7981520.1 16S rRNA (adenine(1518)-N(6)/adenine(1519)-N(6))-dimethyltransferase RsmA [Laspinema sp. D3b]